MDSSSTILRFLDPKMWDLQNIGLASVALLVVVYFMKPSSLARKTTDCISFIVGNYLYLRYPIFHLDGKTQLPTCPYQWPNGQGDVGKFLEGIENSEAWGKTYGQLYRIWSGTASEVVLTKPEQLQAVFKDSNKHLKAVNNNSGYLMSQLLGQCVGLISGSEWRDVRGITEVPFIHKKTPDYISLVTRVTERHFRNLHAQSKLNEGLIDPASDLKLLPFWIVAEILYGELSVEQENELAQLVPLREKVFRHVMKGGVVRMWWSKYLPIEATQCFNHFRSKWLAFNDAAYKRATQLGSDVPIVAMNKAVERGAIGKEQLYQTLDEMLFANLDVTNGGMSWSLVFLAAYPRVQDKLRKEVNLSSNDDRAQYLLSSSTFLGACISESARLKPLAAFSIPQSTPTDRVVSGFNIPAGTDFIIDSYALNIRNEFWGPDRTSYRPERFSELNTTNMRYNFWRFGFGPRQCLGKYVADLIIRVLLEHLVKNYRLDLLDAAGKWQRNPESWITIPDMHLRCVQTQS